MANELVPNPSSCAGFEPNPFRRERCRECGHQWQLHRGVISEAFLQEARNMATSISRATERRATERQEEATRNRRKMKKQKRQRQQAVEDDWLFDRTGTCDSISSGPSADDSGDDGFTMWYASEFKSSSLQNFVPVPTAALPHIQGPRIRNLIDFTECDVPMAPMVSRTASSSTCPVPIPVWQSTAGMSTHSEETLRQDAGASSSSCSAVNVVEKTTFESSSTSGAYMGLSRDTSDNIRSLGVCEAPFANDAKSVLQERWLDLQAKADQHHLELARAKADFDRRIAFASAEAMRASCDLRETRIKFDAQTKELVAARDAARAQLDWWEASDTMLKSKSEAEIRSWEEKYREASQRTLEKLSEKRLELRLASSLMAAADAGLCKICYDQPSSCALLPCRHHAFCYPCAVAVHGDNEPVCPICRRTVDGVFRTYTA